MDEKTQHAVIKRMTIANNIACKKLSEIDFVQVHKTCESFKDMAGLIGSHLQMVSPSTIQFIANYGGDIDKLKKAPTISNNLRTELESVKDYLIEILSYID